MGHRYIHNFLLNHLGMDKLSTYSKYKKTDVRKEWTASMMASLVEPSCYWTIELIYSGLFVDLWELILSFYGTFIHCGNPKLPIYLEMRFQTFKTDANKVSDLELRKNVDIRNIFIEIIYILCTSNKQNSYNTIPIISDGIPASRLKAPTIEYNKGFRPTDPKDMFISMNEFGYMLHTKNVQGACYWVEWVIKNKKKCAILNRNYSSKYKQDCIWLIWDTIIAYSKEGLTIKIINSLISLFSISYTPTTKEKRRFLIYYAISLCCDTVPLDIDIMTDKTDKIKSVHEKCEKIFKKYDDIK